ncbi:MAG TPA: hypothetical protein P5081_13750 [Phycisphaerae bacterium]|nr:hypothetical protein [Phycisphaerae bacterium]HRW53935.1 hypothetical protein [Phycisphaerae bacterium]
MQHHGHNNHIDDFSVSDIRHTLHEIWRVVRDRRWLFVMPACLVSSVAFLCSLLVPRLYDGGAIVKSEHDPVFSIVNASIWAQPFAEIKNRMQSVIKDPALIEEALAACGRLDRLERFPDGTLTPEGKRQRDHLISTIAAGLSVKTISESDNERIVQITMRHADRELIPGVVREIRNRYIPKATEMAVSVLEDVQSFLRTEADKSRQRIAALNQQIVEYELKYPGIDPDKPDHLDAEQTKLVIEKVDIEREIQELRLFEAELQNSLAMLSGDSREAPGAAREIPNPRRTELLEEIQRLREEIRVGVTQKEMTDAHPTIVRIKELLAARQLEYDETPPTIPEFNGAEAETNRYAALEETQRQSDKLATRVDSKDRRLAAVVGRLAEIERVRAAAMEHRQAYHKAKAEMTRLKEDLNQWQEQIAPVSQVLYLDNKNRSVRFSAIQGAWVSPTPVTPKSSLVMLICMGIGGAVGVLVVLIAELLDHSYRTAKQLTTSLGLPVIESVGEIMTAANMRRRMIRKVLVMPVAATIAITAATSSGLLAYLSLENPAKYGRVADSARRTVNEMLGNQ